MANHLRLASFTLFEFFFVSYSIFVHFVTLSVVWCDDSVQFDWIRLNAIRFNFIRQNSDSLFSRFLLLNRLISSVWRNFSIIFGCMTYWNCYIIVQYHVFTGKIKKRTREWRKAILIFIEVALLWFSSIRNGDFKVSVKNWNDISISFIDTS